MTYSNLIGDRLVAISSEVGYLTHLADTLPTQTTSDRDKAVSTLHRDLARIEKELNLYETTLLPKYIGNVPYLQQQVFNLKYWMEATAMAV
jgi:hypothetical protein